MNAKLIGGIVTALGLIALIWPDSGKEKKEIAPPDPAPDNQDQTPSPEPNPDNLAADAGDPAEAVEIEEGELEQDET